MTPDTELRAPAPPAGEFYEEQEVDLGRYWSALTARWWLLLAGVVVGLAVGYATAVGGTAVFQAQAVVYLGQPLSGGNPVLSAPTQLGLVGELVRAESTLRRVAAEVGMPVAQLRGHVDTKAVLGITTGRLGAPAPLASITVTGRPARKVEAAANALAALVVNRLSTYAAVKIQTHLDRLAYDARQLQIVRERLAVAQQEQQGVLGNSKLDPAERLIALENFNSVIVSSEARQGALEADQFTVKQSLELARDVEHGNIVTRAVATETSARSRRTSMIVGAIVGVIVAILAAFLWEPARRRLRGRAA